MAVVISRTPFFPVEGAPGCLQWFNSAHTRASSCSRPVLWSAGDANPWFTRSTTKVAARRRGRVAWMVGGSRWKVCQRHQQLPRRLRTTTTPEDRWRGWRVSVETDSPAHLFLSRSQYCSLDYLWGNSAKYLSQHQRPTTIDRLWLFWQKQRSSWSQLSSQILLRICPSGRSHALHWCPNSKKKFPKKKQKKNRIKGFSPSFCPHLITRGGVGCRSGDGV